MDPARPVPFQQHVTHLCSPALASLLHAVAASAVSIAGHVRSAGLSGGLGAAGAVNVQGEAQQKLDVLANQTLLNALSAVPSAVAAVSEENDEPITLPGAALPAAEQYVCIFDPLDGSSNIDVNVNVGTIVSIQRFHGDVTSSALRRGTDQAAALYVNYGPATTLVYTVGNGVHAFTLDGSDFLLTAEHLQMPPRGPFYSVNEGRAGDFPAPYPEFLRGLRDGSLLGDAYSSRYVGSFIADFHRTLLKGGVFLYPPTRKTPDGKLRLLYEANPLSLIAEQAGGAATDGTQRILERKADGIHSRTPLVIGSRDEVEGFLRLAKAHAAP